MGGYGGYGYGGGYGSYSYGGGFAYTGGGGSSAALETVTVTGTRPVSSGQTDYWY